MAHRVVRGIASNVRSSPNSAQKTQHRVRPGWLAQPGRTVANGLILVGIGGKPDIAKASKNDVIDPKMG